MCRGQGSPSRGDGRCAFRGELAARGARSTHVHGSFAISACCRCLLVNEFRTRDPERGRKKKDVREDLPLACGRRQPRNPCAWEFSLRGGHGNVWEEG